MIIFWTLWRVPGGILIAGPEIVLTRANGEGQPPAVQRIGVKALINGGDPTLNVALFGGEEIRVPIAEQIVVTGNVMSPGSFPIIDPATATVNSFIAQAHGLAQYWGHTAYIYRLDEQGNRHEIPVHCWGIQKRTNRLMFSCRRKIFCSYRQSGIALDPGTGDCHDQLWHLGRCRCGHLFRSPVMAGSAIKTIEELEPLREEWRRAGKKVVWTNGCFDVIHAGHVRSLADAKALGDILLVGLNSDASVRRLKGIQRPFIGQQDRAEMLAALRPVDYVIIFDDDDPIPMLRRLQPDVHCKGADYADGSRPMPERDVVTAYGGEIRFLPFHPGLSTSSLIRAIADAQIAAACEQ